MFSFFKKKKQDVVKTFPAEGSATRKEYIELQIARTLEKSRHLSEKDTQIKAERLAVIANFLNISTLRKVLIIGCRNSTEQDLLEAAGAGHVTAIDLVSLDPRIIVCDMHDIVIAEDGEYDFILCSHALEHALDYMRVLDEVRRTLAPEGVVFFEVPTHFTPSGADLHDFSDSQNLKSIIESVFGQIEVLYAEDIKTKSSMAGTDVARILFKKNV